MYLENFFQDFINSLFINNLNISLFNIYTDNYYNFILHVNSATIVNNYSLNSNLTIYFVFFNFLLKFIKINIILSIVFYIFFLTSLENYIKQLVYMNSLTKLFILNENEKEVGPADDFFFFAILFILTIMSFVIMSFVIIILNTNIFIWAMASLFLISLLILTVPLNLFVDFGISYFAYIRGSASSTSLIKELLFDIISTFTVFIRFVIQNIRFLFIFSAIFELLEWVFANNSSFFIISDFYSYNLFSNFSATEYSYTTKNFNLLLVNTLMFVILYFYYSLHLIFLLLVQITIYIGISVWLFFFLYSTKFLGKYEKFFNLRK